MEHYTKYWFLEHFDFMKKLGKTKLMQISEDLEMHYITKGEVIRFGGDNDKQIVFLKSGSVKIVGSERAETKYLVTENNIFGELDSSNSDFTNSEHAIALEDCVICLIDAHKMNEIINSNASLKNSMIRIQSLKIRRLERRLSDLLYKDSATRIYEFIIAFVNEYGKEQGDRVIARNNLSHTDIAHLTNTSRQTVNNVLTNLRKQGTIDYSRKEISLMLSNKRD